MRTPGPDHPITLEPAASRIRAAVDGHVIADTADALILKETTYPAVVYFPREDVDMPVAVKTARTTECPYKGQASYYTFTVRGDVLEDVAWSYEAPYPAMAALAGRIAFYADRVKIYAVNEPSERAAAV